MNGAVYGSDVISNISRGVISLRLALSELPRISDVPLLKARKAAVEKRQRKTAPKMRCSATLLLGYGNHHQHHHHYRRCSYPIPSHPISFRAISSQLISSQF